MDILIIFPVFLLVYVLIPLIAHRRSRARKQGLTYQQRKNVLIWTATVVIILLTLE